MPRDSKYVSLQDHEIKAIANNWQDEHNQPLGELSVLVIHGMLSRNFKRILRSDFYGTLGALGFTTKPKE